MTKLLRTHVPVLAALVLFAAFAAPVATAPPAAAQTDDVVLLDPGAEPRTVLRVRLHKGDVSRCEFRFGGTSEYRAGGEVAQQDDTGTVEGTIVTKIGAVSRDGSAVATFSFDDVHSTSLPSSHSIDEDDPGPAENAARAAAVEQIDGVVGTSVVDERNRFTAGDVAGDDALDDDTDDVLSSILDHFDTQNVWFPVEPVGVGASWKVSDSGSYVGINGTEEVVYTLESRTKNTAVVSYAITRQAAPGPIAPPGMPNDAMVNLQSLSFTGQGRLTLALDHPVTPTRSQGRQQGAVTMDVSQDGFDVAVTATVDSSLSLQPTGKASATKATGTKATGTRSAGADAKRRPSTRAEAVAYAPNP